MRSARSHGEILVAALVAAGSLPIGRLFRDGGVGPAMLFAIAVSATLAWLLRRSRLAAPLAAVVSAGAFFWFAGLLFYRQTLAGPLPTPGMFAAVARGIGDGIGMATAEVAPVAATTPLLTLVLFAVWSASWLADDAVFKLRHPLLAIGFVLPMFVFPGTLIPSSHLWLDAALFVGACMAVLFTEESSRLARWGKTAGYGGAGWKPGLATRIGTVVVVASVALAPLVPGYAREPGFEETGAEGGGGSRVALNPLVSIKPSLSDDTVTPLFTVESPVASYWRITALDVFEPVNQVWTAPPRPARASISNRTVAPSVAGGKRVVQRFRMQALGGPWLPAAYEPVRVNKRGRVTVEPVSRSLLAPAIRPGDRPEVVSMIVNPTADQLDEVSTESMSAAALEPVVLIPPGVPESVVSLAHRVTRAARTPFRKAVALQNFLREFVYNEDVRAGHSFDNLVEFLFEAREGYCEQFAGAMGILARIVGLPSRVAIGFTVGNAAGRDTYQVTTRHAHAWVEIFFPGYGWLPFEPTPRGDSTTIVPAYARDAAGSGGPSIPPPGATASPSPTATSSINPKLAGDDNTNSLQNLPPAGGRRGSAAKSLLVPAALLALAGVLLPGAALARRTLRRRRAKDSGDVALSYYADFLDWCAAAGLPRTPGETPAQYARRLAGQFAPAEGPLRELAALAAGALWAPGAPAAGAGSDAARLGREAQRAIAGRLPLRTRLLPAVGWGWWRGGFA